MIEVVVGTNSLLVRQAVHKVLQAFADAYDRTAIEQYDADQLDPVQLPGILQAMPFLSEKRMVVLRGVSGNKMLAEKVQDVLADTPETTDVLIVEAAPDKRTAFYKFLLKQKNVQRCDDLDSNELSKWLVQAAGDRGGKLSVPDARYLIERVSSNQMQLSHEIDKLIAYEPNITKETIDALTERSPQSSVFELLDAAFSGNTKRAISLYEEQRMQRVEPQAIVGMIAWQLHILAVVKAAGDRSPDTIARDAKLSPFVVRKSLGLVQHTTLARIREWVDVTLKLDVDLKSKSRNADDAVQHLLLTFTQK